MKRLLFVLLIMLTMLLQVGCKQDKLPPKNGEDVTFVTSDLIYQNDGSTVYSIGDIGPIFTFYDDTLDVKNSEEVNTYEISYDKTDLTIEDFEKQFQYESDESKIPDISSYKNIVQYDLCKPTNDLPGYRLYILDGHYWMGTLYKNSIWRIVSLDIDK